VRSIRIQYGEQGRRSVQRSQVLRIVLIVLAVLVLILIVSYIVFNIGGTVPGSGEGDPVPTP
jgi:uncharacterized BrkB/YihY/UPF0761 family membrane protein